MVRKKSTRIISMILTAVLMLAVFVVLTACDRLEDRADYIEENGWIALITSEEFKAAKLIGNKENSIINGEAILPTNIMDYEISYIQDNGGISLTISCFDFMPDKLFIPGVNYRFSNMICFPRADKMKVIFLCADTDKYTNGFNLNNDNRTSYAYTGAGIYYVPSAFLDDFKSQYDKCTYGEFKGASVSYFYNYEDSPNGGYCWIDDVDAGDKIKTIPNAPQRDKYNFGGWYTEEECINVFDFESFTMEENGELNLYAKWILK